jgi:SAM-dependent methyltransferase
MNTDLIAYYKDRAAEYEKIYTKPERQPDLEQATAYLHQAFQGKSIFEICCGTGYWTERLAKTAACITATDINASVLEIAKSKTYRPATVTFESADIYHLPDTPLYESLFGGFIWSHIPIAKLNFFLDAVHRRLAPGGLVVFMYNNYVAGSNIPITRTDAAGNTYQKRRLENGTTYEVLKNFPTPEFLRGVLGNTATDINVRSLTYFWIVT